MDTEKATMSLQSKREYLGRIHGRYQSGGREHKSRILDEFCSVCGYDRKFALRLLNRPLDRPRRKPGPDPVYDADILLPALREIWLAAEQPCGKLLKAALPLWLGFAGELEAGLQRDLLRMSAATLDRMLKPLRFKPRRRGWGATRPGTFLRQHVPVRPGPAQNSVLGHIEADTVAHGGGFGCGQLPLQPYLY